MHDFRNQILLAFAALIFFGTANAVRAQTQPNTAATTANAPSSTGSAQRTQALGYWVDPSTGLIWTAKDNAEDVNWHQAVSYCHHLRMAGFSDWRLGTLDELASLVDKSDLAPERVGNMEIIKINLDRHVRGGLLLTGDPWSSNREKDRFGHPYGPGWFFDFSTSKPSYDLPYFRNTKYALCVRRPGK